MPKPTDKGARKRDREEDVDAPPPEEEEEPVGDDPDRTKKRKKELPDLQHLEEAPDTMTLQEYSMAALEAELKRRGLRAQVEQGVKGTDKKAELSERLERAWELTSNDEARIHKAVLYSRDALKTDLTKETMRNLVKARREIDVASPMTVDQLVELLLSDERAEAYRARPKRAPIEAPEGGQTAQRRPPRDPSQGARPVGRPKGVTGQLPADATRALNQSLPALARTTRQFAMSTGGLAQVCLLVNIIATGRSASRHQNHLYMIGSNPQDATSVLEQHSALKEHDPDDPEESSRQIIDIFDDIAINKFLKPQPRAPRPEAAAAAAAATAAAATASTAATAAPAASAAPAAPAASVAPAEPPVPEPPAPPAPAQEV